MANAKASSLARRRKEENAIIQGNLRLYRRLQSVKPSADVDHRKIERDFEKNKRWAPVTKREKPRPPPPGLHTPRAWDDRWHVDERSHVLSL